MIRINLLPFRAARKKENIRRQISIFLLSFFLVMAVLIFYNMHLNGKIEDLKGRIEVTKKEVKKYKKITKQIEEIKRKLAILEKKIEVIRKLESNRFEPVQILDTMSQKVIEKRMWFTGFTDKPDSLLINGIALDNQTVADFMVRLEGTGLFSAVDLKTIEKQVVRGSNLKKFQIACTKKPQPATTPAK
jgi:type IV pilus assembly protein PilN